MFRKLLNSYYYGKSGKGDYRKTDLPQNRWQQFREMLRVRLAGLFRLNLITALAYVPTIYVLIITLSALLTHLSVVAEVAADQAAASAEYLAIFNNSAQEVYSILFTGCLLLIPAIAITGPVQAGMALVTRNWARDEHAFVWGDFLDAVKANWKQALGASLITGLIPLVVLVSYQFYGAMAQNSAFFVVPQMLVVGLGLVWMLSLVYLYPMMVTYQMAFRTLLRNSLLLALGRLPHTAGVRLLMLIPTAIALIVSLMTPNWMYAVMALAGYYLLIGNALARFFYAAFSNAMFDRFINVRIPGAQVNRGLADREGMDEEEEDEPEASAVPEDSPGSLV
ncbi:MAG: YesL family protein [Eubacteriales bacterium]|nr:YesL family protein [Eubacteriales bacterium]